MHLLLEHFNNFIPHDAVIDYRTCDLSLHIVLEGQARLRELTQDHCEGGILIVNVEAERNLLRTISGQYGHSAYSLHNSLDKAIIAGLRCHVSNDLPRFRYDGRWSYMLADRHVVGLLTYEPAKLL